MHSQIEEQDFQEIENSSPKSLEEGNLSNLCEGGGEIGETEEPRSPLGILHPLSSPDKGSAIKVIPTLSSQLRNNSLEIPEGYWHIFDQMAHNQQTPQTSTL